MFSHFVINSSFCFASFSEGKEKGVSKVIYVQRTRRGYDAFGDKGGVRMGYWPVWVHGRRWKRKERLDRAGSLCVSR